MTFRPLLFACILAFPLGLAAQGCSDDPAPATTRAGDAGALTIAPAQTHSGFDGTHKYRVPVAVYGAFTDVKLTGDSAKVTVEPMQLVDPQDDIGAWYFVTGKVAGDVTMTATSKGRTTTAKITFTNYPAADYAIAEEHYMNGVGKEPPCVTCHMETGGIDHSPTVMAVLTDDQVWGTMQSGVLPSGEKIKTTAHTWTVTEAERKGFMSLLRALSPKGFEARK